MRIGLHLLDIGAFKTQGGVLLHDVGALMRRHGTFDFLSGYMPALPQSAGSIKLP